MGFDLKLDFDSIRSEDGFYQINGCVEYVAARARQYLKTADICWMETPTPDVKIAARFSQLVK